ncbi:MAG TPA: hypothetical protein VFL47_13360, partial [Flavisolibacter sp.]|nr:hypothetical protein [Flavisolibacter sp.]
KNTVKGVLLANFQQQVFFKKCQNLFHGNAGVFTISSILFGIYAAFFTIHYSPLTRGLLCDGHQSIVPSSVKQTRQRGS